MHLKLIGVLLLILGAYLVTAAFVSAEQQHNDSLITQMQPMAAIFLVLLVRVLQAEKHHRDSLKYFQIDKLEEPAEENQELLQPTT